MLHQAITYKTLTLFLASFIFNRWVRSIESKNKRIAFSSRKPSKMKVSKPHQNFTGFSKKNCRTRNSTLDSILILFNVWNRCKSHINLKSWLSTFYIRSILAWSQANIWPWVISKISGKYMTDPHEITLTFKKWPTWDHSDIQKLDIT